MDKRSKTIIITGGAAGIGAATARRFVAAGWNVALLDIDDAGGEARAAELGNAAAYFHADTRSQAEVQAAVNAARSRFGEIGSVFANAGIHRRNSMLDTTDEEFDLVVKTNIYGTYHTLRAAVPAIIEAGGGTVVICASDQSFIGKANSFAYGLTKGALAQITKSLALDLAPKGVRVNAVCPGTVRTPLVDRLFERIAPACGMSVDELWAEEDREFPIGRCADPSEVAEAVFFLASESSSFCTGSLLPVDGGLTAR